MKKEIIKIIVTSVIENANEVCNTYVDLKANGSVHVVHKLYDECHDEILKLEEYGKIIKSLVKAVEYEYDVMNNSYRFTFDTNYGKREDFVPIEPVKLDYYISVRIDWI